MDATRLKSLAACAIAMELIFSTDCVADQSASHESGQGTISWTIEGQPTSIACSRFGAEQVEVRVFDVSGRVRRSAVVPCHDSHVAVALEPGVYHAELVLLDDIGRPISLVIASKAFHVGVESSVAAAVNFPGCPDVRPPLPDCGNKPVVELRDAIGCLTGYGCEGEEQKSNVQ
jgi:hypothetical protein